MPTLVILAAGMSSRYGASKQFEPVGPRGEALMDFAVFDALQNGGDRVVMVINPSSADEARRRTGRWTSVEVEFVLQDSHPVAGRKKPWGTAHAVLEASRRLDDGFVVINADDFYGAGAIRSAFSFLRDQPDRNALVGFNAGLTMSSAGGVSRGVIAEAGGFVKRITEAKNLHPDSDVLRGRTVEGEPMTISPDSPVSMNIWAFGRNIRDHLEKAFETFIERYGNDTDHEFFIGDVVNDIVASDPGSFQLLHAQEPWFGMTFPDDKTLVRDRLTDLTSDGKYPSPLFEE